MVDTLSDLIAPYVTGSNGAILVGTWSVIELMSPAVNAVVMSRLMLPYRLKLYAAAKHGKRVAALIWCSGLVWIPTLQPPLCDAEGLGACQTVLERLATGAALGVCLSFGHMSAARAIRRLTGSTKKVVIACAHCGHKSKVESLSEPCPSCGQPPHEVTRG